MLTLSFLSFDLIKDLSRAGPLVEYERRIGAGDLVDGDSCQVLQSMLFYKSSKERVNTLQNAYVNFYEIRS